jgi:ferredoxin
MIIQQKDFLSFLYKCQDEGIGGIKNVILPTKSESNEENLFFTNLSKDNREYVFDAYRTVDPIRFLYYFPRETIIPSDKKGYKRIIVGAKACDLQALKVLDRALINEDFIDPIYKFWRDNTYLISSDCDYISPTCHCNLVDGTPYPKDGFDLNLSRIDERFHITTGSSKGEELISMMKKYVTFSEESQNILEFVESNRKSVIKELTESNKQFERDSSYDNLRKANIVKWVEESKTCIGCGGCTNICPTCYCLILNDESEGNNFIKVRSYDSCQLHGYARVAGGANPRPKMYQRFRNRYLCKFDYMKSNFGMLGCVGCGRCTDVCAGGIEFRDVLRKMLESQEEMVRSTI